MSERPADPPSGPPTATPVEKQKVTPNPAAHPTLARIGDAGPVPAGPWPGGLPPKLPARLGRYELLEELGRGGMGAVYLAHDTQLDRRIALKVPTFAAGDVAGRERFLREARAAGLVSHPNLCPVHDVGEIDGVPFLTMAYVEGKPLSALLDEGRKLPVRAAVGMVRQLAQAMQAAHECGVIHRDLKPANIMITPRKQPVIMDFGLARRGDSADIRLTREGFIMGTPAYMAPEQVRGEHTAVGPAADIYCLGVVLYELLTGQLPFTGEVYELLAKVALDDPPSPQTHRPDLDPVIADICLKCLAKQPADRFESMKALATALGDYQRRMTTVAPGTTDNPFAALMEGGTGAVPRPGKYPRWLKLVAVACMLGLSLGLLGVGLGRWLRPDPASGGSAKAETPVVPNTGPPVVRVEPPPVPTVTPPKVEPPVATGSAVFVGPPPPTPQELAAVRPPVAPPPTRPARTAVPSPDAQAAAERAIHDQYQAEFARTDRAGQVALMNTLRKLAEETKGDPATQYVLLREARELAIRAAHPTGAVAAIDLLGRTFDVDGPALKAAALEAMRPNLPNPAASDTGRQQLAEWAEAAAAAAEEAVAAEQFAAAIALLVSTAQVAPRPMSAALATKAQARLAEVQSVQAEHAVQPAVLDRLRQSPGDPEANLTRGRYLALQLGRWADALPLLAKAGDPRWKAAADRDLARPRDSAADRSSGDAWWDLADTERGPAQDAIRRRAVSWYEQALPDAGAAARIKQFGGAPDLARAPVALDLDLRDPKYDQGTDADKGYEWGHAGGYHFMRKAGPGWWYRIKGVGQCPPAFACQLVARVTGPPSDGWRLVLADLDGNHTTALECNSEGILAVEAAVDRGRRGVRSLARISHPAIRPHGAFNRLLVVGRGRTLEVYANDRLVHPPLTLERDIGRCKLHLGVHSRDQGALAEFERLTIWNAADVPAWAER